MNIDRMIIINLYRLKQVVEFMFNKDTSMKVETNIIRYHYFLSKLELVIYINNILL